MNNTTRRFCILLCFTTAFQLSAAPLISDSFTVGAGDYSAGALSTQIGTPEIGSYEAAWSGTGTSTTFGDPSVVSSGLTYAGLSSSGGSVSLNRTSGSGSIIKSASVNPNGTTTASDPSVYFSGLLQLGGATWASIGLQVGTNSGTKDLIGIGFNNGGFAEIRQDGTVSATAGSALGGWTSSNTVFVVGKITNAANDLVTLYLNPTLGSEPVTATLSTTVGTLGYFPGDPLHNLQLSANLVTGGAATFVDELKVGTTWSDVVSVIPEPSTFALMGLAGLAALLGRRRRVS
jgi:hypothetical protein